MLRKPQLLLLISIALLTLSAARAQSGRRSTGSGSTTTTTTTSSTPAAKTAEKKPAAAARVQLLVGIDRTGAFTTTPFYVYDSILEDCIRRLSDAEIVFANSGGNNMNRSAAIKAAKEETTRWTVSLEVKSFYAESGRQIKPEQDELYVDFAVIEPVTGKIKHSGRTQRHIYQQSGRGGNSLPTTKGQPNYSEYSIKQVAVEAADKILAAFDIKVRESF